MPACPVAHGMRAAGHADAALSLAVMSEMVEAACLSEQLIHLMIDYSSKNSYWNI